MPKLITMKIVGNDYVPAMPSKATHIKIKLPGIMPTRILPLDRWQWNGDVNYPTIHPSILTRSNYSKGEVVCHSWVRDGKVQFLGDCTHSLAKLPNSSTGCLGKSV